MQCLLVDDDKALCDLLAEYFADAAITLDYVHCGAQAPAALCRAAYDVVLLDVMLPDGDGYGVLAGLRRVSSVPVIMLTAKGDEEDRVRGLEAGAYDYLAKPFSSRELVARMRALNRRTTQAEASAAGDLALDPHTGRVCIGEREVQLTPVEAAALQLLCRHAGQPVHRDELYRYALRRESSPYDRSLDTHVSNLRGKLGKRADGAARITAVRGVGYQLSP